MVLFFHLLAIICLTYLLIYHCFHSWHFMFLRTVCLTLTPRRPLESLSVFKASLSFQNRKRMPSREDTIVLFDVDGTLTVSRKLVKPEMKELLLQKLKAKATIGLVSGSDLKKIEEQMGADCIKEFDFVFTENGLVAHKNGALIGKENIAAFMGEEKLQTFINFCLGYMSKLKLPVKRGGFIEFRNGLINVCPPGRAVSQEQRDAFGELDNKEQIRKAFVQALEKEFPDLGLRFAIGGQISIDAYPHGWDKRFCLKFIENDFKDIYFFGDRTNEGGNDHDIYSDPRTKGYSVENPEDTMKQLTDIFQL